MPEQKRKVFCLLVEACNALRRKNHEVLYASMIKDTMKRKKPSFDDSYYGYRSFTHLLEDADNLALVNIERNPKSGTYVVTRVCGEGRDREPGPSPGLTSSRHAPGAGSIPATGHGAGTTSNSAQLQANRPPPLSRFAGPGMLQGPARPPARRIDTSS